MSGLTWLAVVGAVCGVVLQALEPAVVEEVRPSLASGNAVERLLLGEVAQLVDGVAVRPADACPATATQRKGRLARACARPSATVASGLSFRHGHHPFLPPVDVVLQRHVDVALWQRAERGHTCMPRQHHPEVSIGGDTGPQICATTGQERKGSATPARLKSSGW